MHNESSNVVRLDSFGQSAPKPSAQHQIILQQLRTQYKKHLLGYLAEMFDQTDDKLFDLADRSDSNDDQLLYFGSMRLLRLKRQKLEAEFIKNIDILNICNT